MVQAAEKAATTAAAATPPAAAVAPRARSTLLTWIQSSQTAEERPESGTRIPSAFPSADAGADAPVRHKGLKDIGMRVSLLQIITSAAAARASASSLPIAIAPAAEQDETSEMLLADGGKYEGPSLTEVTV